MAASNTIVSNFVNDKWIERLYMNVNKSVYLVRPDGEVDSCKVKKLNLNITWQVQANGLTILAYPAQRLLT